MPIRTSRMVPNLFRRQSLLLSYFTTSSWDLMSDLPQVRHTQQGTEGLKSHIQLCAPSYRGRAAASSVPLSSTVAGYQIVRSIQWVLQLQVGRQLFSNYDRQYCGIWVWNPLGAAMIWGHADASFHLLLRQSEIINRQLARRQRYESGVGTKQFGRSPMRGFHPAWISISETQPGNRPAAVESIQHSSTRYQAICPGGTARKQQGNHTKQAPSGQDVGSLMGYMVSWSGQFSPKPGVECQG